MSYQIRPSRELLSRWLVEEMEKERLEEFEAGTGRKRRLMGTVDRPRSASNG